MFLFLKFQLCLFLLHADPLLALKNWTPTIHFSLIEDKPFSNHFEVISVCFTCLLLSKNGYQQSIIRHLYEQTTLSFFQSLSHPYAAMPTYAVHSKGLRLRTLGLRALLNVVLLPPGLYIRAGSRRSSSASLPAITGYFHCFMNQDTLRRSCLSGPTTVYFSQNFGYLKT